MSQRWLCDENIPRALVLALEQLGQDVVWIGNVAPGSSDAAVLARARLDQRIVLTFDKDFGEFAARSRLLVTSGVALLRVQVRAFAADAGAIAATLAARADWAGHFSVIEPGRLRMRRLDIE